MKQGLERFLSAQEESYPIALQEIKNGRKQSHWSWFIFPQIKGLSFSATGVYYAIRDLEEAKAYLEEPRLGGRMLEISEALLELETSDPIEVMGYIDALKLRSSMTLFQIAKPECEVFQKVLDKFYDGKADEKTIAILNAQG